MVDVPDTDPVEELTPSPTKKVVPVALRTP